MDKYNILKNGNRVDYQYKVGDKVILNNKSAYKYKTPYNGPFCITQCWTNDKVKLKMDEIKLGIIYVSLSTIKLKSDAKTFHLYLPATYFYI